jgi:hypothetical protein
MSKKSIQKKQYDEEDGAGSSLQIQHLSQSSVGSYNLVNIIPGEFPGVFILGRPPELDLYRFFRFDLLEFRLLFELKAVLLRSTETDREQDYHRSKQKTTSTHQ